jgi:hypothetical protein
LAAVYLLLLRERPTRAWTWTFESELARPYEKLPDAIIRDGGVKTAIELAGQYGNPFQRNTLRALWHLGTT